MLKGDTLDGQDIRCEALGVSFVVGMIWESFEELFKKKCYTTCDQRLLERELLTLKKVDKAINEYTRLFVEELQFVAVYAEMRRLEWDVMSLIYQPSVMDFVGEAELWAETIEESKSVDDDLKI